MESVLRKSKDIEDGHLLKSWYGPANGGTHVKRAPHEEGKDGGGGSGRQVMSSAEIGPLLKDNRRACKAAVMEMLRSAYQGHAKRIDTANGDTVIVAWSGIRHGMNNGLPTWQESVAALHINDLVRHSILESTKPDKLGRKDPFATSVYGVEADFDGVPHDVKIYVRHHSDGRRYYDHVVIERKTPAGLTGSGASDFPSAPPTLPFTGAVSSIPNPQDKATKSFDEKFDLLKSHIDALRSNHA